MGVYGMCGRGTPRNCLEGPLTAEISVLTKIFSVFNSALRRVSAELTKDSTILSQLLTLLRSARAENDQ